MQVPGDKIFGNNMRFFFIGLGRVISVPVLFFPHEEQKLESGRSQVPQESQASLDFEH